MRIETYDKKRASALLARPASRADVAPEEVVRRIVEGVRAEGDAALLRLTRELDGASLDELEVSETEFAEAEAAVPGETLASLERAAERIRRFHHALTPPETDLDVASGVRCRRVWRPIERVGLYVPAGSAPLPSTALMLGIPATIAGCALRVACTPPRADGTIDPLTLVAARLSGIDRVFKLGGAQAIAALAFGTASVPGVDKIFGPGNAWVTAAKLDVARRAPGVAIDSPAGPSEVMVIADRSARADFVAADLLSQAEHDPLAHTVLVTFDATQARAIVDELSRRAGATPRAEIARASLEGSIAVVVPDRETALEVINGYAPEHLILQVEEADSWVPQVKHAGSVFLGPWTPEAVGDYASGTNHVLPTMGYSRSYGGLSVETFMKSMTVQRLSEAGLRDLGPTVMTLASAEGLEAHSAAVAVRLEALEEGGEPR